MNKARSALRFALQRLGSPYVYGGSGKPCTPEYRRARMKQYPGSAKAIARNCPVLSGKADSCSACRYRGRDCFDCAQLVKLALKAEGILLPSGASSQWKAGAIWAFRGEVTHVARSHACVLFRKDAQGSADRPMAHVGLSLGDGRVIDARGHQAGVMQSKITAYPWTHMAFPKGFPVPAELTGKEAILAPLTFEQPPEKKPKAALQDLSLALGERGELVRLLQNQLLRLGYPLPRFGADGKYGRETSQAVVAFQRVTGLAPTGQAGVETMARLFPKPQPFLEAGEEDDDDDELFDLF